MPLAKLNNIVMNYKVEGHGEPLVMIMGFTASRSGWMSQIPFFRKYYQLITFDNRGVGKTSKPPGPYTTKMMADDLVKLLDYLKIEKANIMGTSMGGMIAQEFAINYPSKVIKLVLASTYAIPGKPDEISPEQANLVQLSDYQMSVGLIGLAFDKPFYRMTFGTLARIRSKFIGTSTMIGIAGQREACSTHNTLDRLKLITAPTLVIAGSKDRIINPASSELIAGKIPDAKLVKIEGGSHSFSLEMKKVFNKAVLDFLKDKPS